MKPIHVFALLFLVALLGLVFPTFVLTVAAAAGFTGFLGEVVSGRY